MQPQIVAIGGGGFSAESGNLLLEKYILNLTKKTNPKVCFVPTASGDSERYLLKFYTAFKELQATTSHLPLFQLAVTDLRSHILGQDIIYVGGGNTRNMLLIWRAFGVDTVLREAWEQGTTLCGVSAGSICWFEQGVTDSLVPNELRPMDGLGFLPGSNCPHYDGEPLRRPSFQRFVADGSISDGFAADDWACLHFAGRDLHRVVSAKSGANAYQVTRNQMSFREEVITPVLLADEDGLGTSLDAPERNVE